MAEPGSKQAFEAAVVFLAETPRKVERLLQGLGEDQIRRRPAPGAFSVADNVHHLRDIEIDGYEVRLRRILEEDDPRLPDVDGARLAAERRYDERPVLPALREFTSSRSVSVARLGGLAPEALERTADLEGVGRVTVTTLLDRWRTHDAEHLEEIARLRDAARRTR